MSDDPIHDYLGELERGLGRFARHRRRTRAEVEDHLREAAVRIEQSGVSPEEAARQAVEQFGSPQVVARQSSAPSWANRRPVAVAVGVGVVVALVAVIQLWYGVGHRGGSSAAPPGRLCTARELARKTFRSDCWFRSGGVWKPVIVSPSQIQGGRGALSIRLQIPPGSFETTSGVSPAVPVQHALVELRGVGGDKSAWVTTDSAGRFRVVLPPGVYVVGFAGHMDHPGWRVRVIPGETRIQTLNIEAL